MAKALYTTDSHRAAEAVFAFGSLMDRELMALVLDRDVSGVTMTEATIRGYVRRRVAGEYYPALVPQPDGIVVGRLVEGLSPDDIDRIHFYEGDVYDLAPVHAVTADGRRFTAHVFLDGGDLRVSRQGWDFQSWLRHEKDEAMALTRALMRHYGRISLREVEGMWNQIKDQAESLYGYDEEAMAAEAKAYP